MINEQVMSLDNPTGLQLLEILQKIGFSPRTGDQIEISVNERTLVVRSLDETERARKIAAATKEVFDRRREAYQQLAQGPA